MPTGVEVDMAKLAENCKAEIEKFGGKIHAVEEKPIAFGLKAVEVVFLADESKGGTEDLEKALTEIKDVQSAETIDVRRAFG